MPAITETTARTNYKFREHLIGVPLHFAAGHVMSENDAKFANRQLASVLGNVLSSAISRKVAALQEANDKLPDGERKVNADNTNYEFGPKDLDTAVVQALFDEIYGRYEIGVNNARSGEGAVAHDPVEAAARNMAWEIGVKPLLKAKGFKLNTISAEKKNELIEQYLDKMPSIRETAKAQWEGAQAKPAEGLDDLIAGMEAEAKASADTATTDEAATEASGSTPPTDDANATASPARVKGSKASGDNAEAPVENTAPEGGAFG